MPRHKLDRKMETGVSRVAMQLGFVVLVDRFSDALPMQIDRLVLTRCCSCLRVVSSGSHGGSGHGPGLWLSTERQLEAINGWRPFVEDKPIMRIACE